MEKEKLFQLNERQKMLLAEIQAKIDEFKRIGGLLVYWTEDSTVWACNMENAEDYAVVDDWDFHHDNGFKGFTDVTDTLCRQFFDIEYQGSEYGVYAKIRTPKNLF